MEKTSVEQQPHAALSGVSKAPGRCRPMNSFRRRIERQDYVSFLRPPLAVPELLSPLRHVQETGFRRTRMSSNCRKFNSRRDSKDRAKARREKRRKKKA